MSAPGIAQMVNRSNSGHLKALRSVRDSSVMVGASEPASAVRGAMTVLSTLRRWECIEGDALTDRGRDLLAALEEREAAWCARMAGL